MAENVSEVAPEAVAEGTSEGIRGFIDILIEAATGDLVLVWVFYPLAVSTIFVFFFSKSFSLKISLPLLTLSILLLQIPSSGLYNNEAAFFITCVAGFVMLAKWQLEKPAQKAARMR